MGGTRSAAGWAISQGIGTPPLHADFHRCHVPDFPGSYPLWHVPDSGVHPEVPSRHRGGSGVGACPGEPALGISHAPRLWWCTRVTLGKGHRVRYGGGSARRRVRLPLASSTCTGWSPRRGLSLPESHLRAPSLWVGWATGACLCVPGGSDRAGYGHPADVRRFGGEDPRLKGGGVAPRTPGPGHALRTTFFARPLAGADPQPMPEYRSTAPRAVSQAWNEQWCSERESNPPRVSGGGEAGIPGVPPRISTSPAILRLHPGQSVPWLAGQGRDEGVCPRERARRSSERDDTRLPHNEAV